MRKFVAMFAAIAVLVGVSASLVSAGEDAKPKSEMIVGEVIELSTYAMQGGGEEHAEAMRNRIELGFPVGILQDETGEIFVAVYKNPAPASHLETGNRKLAELAGKKVVAQGLVYRKKGLNVIRMSLVSEY